MVVIDQPEDIEQTFTIPLKNVTIGQTETYVYIYRRWFRPRKESLNWTK